MTTDRRVEAYAVIAGAAAWVLCVLLRITSSARLVWIDSLSVVLVVASTWMARRIAQSPTSKREALVVGGVAMGSATLLLQAAVMLVELRVPATIPWQLPPFPNQHGCWWWAPQGVGLYFPRPSILVELAARAWLMGAYSLASWVPFGAALVASAPGAVSSCQPSDRQRTQPPRPWPMTTRWFGIAMAVAVTGLSLVALRLGLRMRADIAAHRAPYDRWEQMLERGDITLPVSRGGGETADLPRWIVTKEGLVDPMFRAVGAQDCPLSVRPWEVPVDVAADASLPLDHVIRAVCRALPNGVQSFRLQARAQVDTLEHTELFRIPLVAYPMVACPYEGGPPAPPHASRPFDEPFARAVAIVSKDGEARFVRFRRGGDRPRVVAMGLEVPLTRPPRPWRLEDLSGWNWSMDVVLVPEPGMTVGAFCTMMDVTGPFFSQAVSISLEWPAFDAAIEEWRRTGAWPP